VTAPRALERVGGELDRNLPLDGMRGTVRLLQEPRQAGFMWEWESEEEEALCVPQLRPQGICSSDEPEAQGIERMTGSDAGNCVAGDGEVVMGGEVRTRDSKMVQKNEKKKKKKKQWKQEKGTRQQGKKKLRTPGRLKRLKSEKSRRREARTARAHSRDQMGETATGKRIRHAGKVKRHCGDRVDGGAAGHVDSWVSVLRGFRLAVRGVDGGAASAKSSAQRKHEGVSMSACIEAARKAVGADALPRGVCDRDLDMRRDVLATFVETFDEVIDRRGCGLIFFTRPEDASDQLTGVALSGQHEGLSGPHQGG